MKYLNYLLNPIEFLRAVKRKFKKNYSFSIADHYSHADINFTPLKNSNVVAGNSWDEHLVDVINEVNAKPMAFLRQKIISWTLHPNQKTLAEAYFTELKQSSFFVQRIMPNLHDVPMGDPYLCDFFPSASPLTIQHAYYLHMMKEQFGVFAPTEVIGNIVEVGGGYGNLCRLIKSYGYEGQYTVVDLPPMLSLQQHYLSHILSPSSLEKVRFSKLDIKTIVQDNKGVKSLLVGTFSINEMPMETREELATKYSDFDYLFFAYDLSFCGIDNRDYFSKLAQKLEADYTIFHQQDKHRRTWFLLCEKK